jgi:glycerol-3-phosphate O-acyltransferase
LTGDQRPGQGNVTARLPERVESLDVRDSRIQGLIRTLARRVNQGVNATAVASGSALLTSCVLAREDSKWDKSLLEARVSVLHAVIQRLALHLGWTVSPSQTGEGEIVQLQEVSAASSSSSTSSSSSAEGVGNGQSVAAKPWSNSRSLDRLVEEILDSAVRFGFLQKESDGIFARNTQKELNLWWYRGTIFHLCAIPGIVALVLMRSQRQIGQLSRSEMAAQVHALRTLWSEELFWPDAAATGEILEAGLRTLVDVGVLNARILAQDTQFQDGDVLNDELLEFFRNLVRPEVEWYSLQLAFAVCQVEAERSTSRDEITRGAYEAHRRAFLRGKASSQAYMSKVFASRVFEGLFRSGLLLPEKDSRFVLSLQDVGTVAHLFDLDSWREFVEV